VYNIKIIYCDISKFREVKMEFKFEFLYIIAKLCSLFCKNDKIRRSL